MSRFSNTSNRTWGRSSSSTMNEEFTGFSSALDEALGEIDRFLSPRTSTSTTPTNLPNDPFNTTTTTNNNNNNTTRGSSPSSSSSSSRPWGPVSYDEFLRRTRDGVGVSGGGGASQSPSMTTFSSSSSSNRVMERRSVTSGRGPPSFYSRTKTEEFYGDSSRPRDKDFYRCVEEVDADGPDTGRIKERSKEVQGSPPPPGGVLGDRGAGVALLGGVGGDKESPFGRFGGLFGRCDGGDRHQQRGPRRWSETGPGYFDGSSSTNSVSSTTSATRVGGGANVAGDAGGMPYVAAFDDIVNGPVARYVSLSNTIGGDVVTHAKMVERAFKIQKKFLEVASRCKEPASPATLQKLLAGTSEVIGQIQTFREKNRASPLFNHLSAWSEGIPALGWVTVAPTPGPHVKEMCDSAQFYTNRVLKDWKEKDKTHAEWVKAILEIFSELQGYVKQHHTTGLVWNNRSGGEPAAADFAALASPSASGSPTPPPPSGGGPPPPPPMIDLSADIARRQASNAPSGGNEKGALFDQLNRGADVTKGLKKVTADMQTHKNPDLRTASAVPAKSSPQAAGAGGAAGAASRFGADPSKPPKLELVNGKKWMVEHQNGVEGLVINVEAINQAVYIFRCTNTVVQVKGKLSSIVMDSCKKTAVVFDSLVGPAEFVNCQGCKMQVIGSVPIVSIDNSDGIQMFVSEECKNSVEIVASKSTEMNVMVPKSDGDFVEYAIPEQFRTTITPSGLATVIADIAG